MILKTSDDTPVEQVIEAVISIADEMIVASANDEYDHLISLDRERIACLAWLFDADTDAGPRFQQATVEDQRVALERLLISNDSLVTVTTKNRDQLANKCTEINRAKQASKAYASHPVIHF